MIQRKSNLWNQKKCGPLRSSENWIVGLKAIGWPEYSHCDWFIFSPLPATPAIQFSLDHKLWSHEGNRK